eukprot:scaffold67274_cov55-Phaeocystis_antarctica.AAC.2
MRGSLRDGWCRDDAIFAPRTWTAWSEGLTRGRRARPAANVLRKTHERRSSCYSGRRLVHPARF